MMMRVMIMAMVCVTMLPALLVLMVPFTVRPASQNRQGVSISLVLTSPTRVWVATQALRFSEEDAVQTSQGSELR